MSKAIWKYGLAEPGSTTALILPEGAEFVHVGLQEHEPAPIQAWFLVDTDATEHAKRYFAVVGTGWTFEDGRPLGTVIHDASKTVWHLIEHDELAALQGEQ